MVVDEGWMWNVPTFSSGSGWRLDVTGHNIHGVIIACGCMGCMWNVTLFMVSLPLVLQWVYGLHVKGHTIYGVTTTCFTVGVWAECERSHYLWCHNHLFYSGCMGCSWNVTLFMVSLPLVLQWVYGLHVNGHTIHGVTTTCFTVGVWAECERWQHPCVTISCVLQWLYNYAECERWQHSCCHYHLF